MSISFATAFIKVSTVESGVNLKSVMTKFGVLKVLFDLRDFISTATLF